MGCGLCGEVAHAAVLCPSFYRARIVTNPSRWERWRAHVAGAVIGWLPRPAHAEAPLPPDAAVGARAITVAILAMGGEGGGVLADWLLEAAEASGFVAQSTSVPGVAQRTGATIYYLDSSAVRGRRLPGRSRSWR